MSPAVYCQIFSPVSALRQYKSGNGLALNSPVEKLAIECDDKTKSKIEKILDDVKGTMNVEEVEFGKGDIEIEGYKIKLSVK